MLKKFSFGDLFLLAFDDAGIHCNESENVKLSFEIRCVDVNIEVFYHQNLFSV